MKSHTCRNYYWKNEKCFRVYTEFACSASLCDCVSYTCDSAPKDSQIQLIEKAERRVQELVNNTMLIIAEKMKRCYTDGIATHFWKFDINILYIQLLRRLYERKIQKCKLKYANLSSRLTGSHNRNMFLHVCMISVPFDIRNQQKLITVLCEKIK